MACFVLSNLSKISGENTGFGRSDGPMAVLEKSETP